MIGKNVVAENSYVGTGSQNLFPITFPTWNAQDLVVFAVDSDTGQSFPLEQVIDFSLSPERDSLTLIDNDAAWVTASGRLRLGFVLYIQFDSEAYQPSRFNDIGGITPVKVTGALDRLTMTLKSVKDLASRALSISGGGSDMDASFPPLQGNGDRIVKVRADEKGFDYGPNVSEIFDARDEAIEAKDLAQAAAVSSGSSATSASVSATASQNSAIASSTAAGNAASSAGNALTSENNAKAYEEEAELWAKYYAYEKVVLVDTAQSPYTVTYAVERNALIKVDASAGPVIINMPNLNDMPDRNWKVAVSRHENDTTSNLIQVNPFSGQTINNLANYAEFPPLQGTVFNDRTPTDWEGLMFLFGSFSQSGASGGLPSGGVAGDYIEKTSSAEGDAAWESGTFSGYSLLLGREVTAVGLRDMILEMANFSYVPPTTTLTASGSNVIRERGANVTATTLTANITKRSNPINRIQFFRGGDSIEDINPPTDTGSQVETFNWTGSFNTNTTFRVEVSDAPSPEGGPTTVSASVSFSFVYPYYYGSFLPGASAAQVGALTKDIIASNNSITRSFTTLAGEVFYFAYPASYPALTSIRDANNFETISSWTRTTRSITGLDATSQSYYIYEFNNIQAAGSASFTFAR